MAGRGGKTPGAGRKKGIPNKVTADIRALAQVHGPAAIAGLHHLAEHAENETTRAAAWNSLLDRGYGRAPQSIAHTGADDGPIVVRIMKFSDG